jgi:DNA-binding CsgD family transcriptional regulator/tetratricopeptide (TPR) repeat protein
MQLRSKAEDANRLIERRDEFAALGDALAGVGCSPPGRLVLVSGEAGIGKTALIAHFCDGLGPGVRVLWAACDPLFTPRPLGPLLDVSRITGGELEEKVEAGAKPHDVAMALLDELGSPAPTVFVLEDLHWADEATLDVLRLTARRRETVAALIIASYRDEELERTHPLRTLLGELPDDASATRLELTGFSREAVASLAEGSAADPEELFERTAGNPFFVTEVLAAEAEQLPRSVRDAVLARASRLSEGARTVLDALSVVPQPTELWLLELLTEAVPGALEECMRSGIVVADRSSVAFRHELARLAIEESLAPDVRLDLHRRALDALASPTSGALDLARLAHHAEAASDDDAVLRFARAAAVEAASVGAHREAQDQYARALRFATRVSDEMRADLLERFADEGYLTDMRDESIDAVDEALAIHRRRGDRLREGVLLRRRSRLLTPCLGRTAEARAAADDAIAVLEQLPPGPELARAYAERSRLAMLADDSGETLRWGGRAIDLAERVGDAPALVQALNTVGTLELGQGNGAGREKLERSLELARGEDLAIDAGRAYVNLVAAFSRRREWEQADRFIAAGLEYCREQGLDVLLVSLIAARAESELYQGRWDAAASTARSILNGSSSTVVGPRFEGLRILALVRARRGETGSGPLLDEALAIANAVGDPQYLAPIAAARAEQALLDGRTGAVAGETERAFAVAVDLGSATWLGELAVWRLRAGLDDEVDVGDADPYALELAGEHKRAADRWAELNCPYEAAFALAGAGEDALLRQSLDEFRRLGAVPAAAMVARRLRERGARGVPRVRRPSTRTNPAGLTAREVEVLELVTEGLRNADIADRLFLSEKTVGHHVSAILRKLDVRSRGQAGAEARRLGIGKAV